MTSTVEHSSMIASVTVHMKKCCGCKMPGQLLPACLTEQTVCALTTNIGFAQAAYVKSVEYINGTWQCIAGPGIEAWQFSTHGHVHVCCSIAVRQSDL